MDILTYSDKLTVLECGVCHISFAMPQQMERKKRQDGTTFWCPNGHQIGYGEHVKAETQRLREQLEASRSLAQRERERREAAQRPAIAYKGVATRVKNRAAHGVCPVPGCRRSFANVARHVAGQHPDFHLETGAHP